MKKLSKMIVITLLISMVMSICAMPVMNVYAAAGAAGAAGATTNSPGSIIEGVTVEQPQQGTSDLQGMAGRILGIIQVASAIAAVVLVAVFGFKFIMGSAEEKSDYMKSFIPLIVGVVVVFAASGIAKLIFNVAGAQ